MIHHFRLPLLCAALTAPLFAQAPAAFEEAATFDASALLDPSSLQGTSYRVRDLVVTDGYLAHFTIDSDFGTFQAIGVPQAKRRILEAEAIRKLVETSKSDLFAEGMKRSINQPIDAVKNIVKHPVDSIKQAPKTAGHFFTQVGSSIGRGVNKVVDRANSDGPAPTATEVGGDISNAAKSASGFDKAKLDTARQLSVDPYSDNTRLQEEMDKVTWAFFAGGLPLRVGAAVASAGIAVTATNMVGIPEETYALTQSELALRDATALTSMGITPEDIRTFQLSAALSTTRRHRIVLALQGLPSARGRGKVIQTASAFSSADDADFFINALALLSERENSGAAKYKELRILGRLPAAITQADTIEVPAPVDYVTWTEEVAAFAARQDLGTLKTLVHTGNLSPATQNGLTANGWQAAAVAYPSL